MEEAKPLHMIGFRLKHGLLKGVYLLMCKKVHCAALIDGTPCKGRPVHYWWTPWCETHAKQERAVYHFLKHVNAGIESIKDSFGDVDNPQLKRIALIMLNLVIVAREAHRDWFYPSQNCPFHIPYETQLIDMRARVTKTLRTMDYAINTKVPEPSLRELMRIALIGMTITSSLHALKGILRL
ncbi:hypothetical protein PG993_003909 [Apiospora rasikravindrae]|uniref:Transposase n=1 Tax=Apiospora rasikravindrae TaxID=990691 RepID=A0ABR1U0V0_9PEZI